MDMQSDDGVLDDKVLSSLRGFALSDSFIPQLISIFEEHGRTSLNELKVAFSSDDQESIRRVAHRFKGSCLNIGAGALASKMKALEESQARGLFSAGLSEFQGEVEQLFELTCKKLHDWH